MSRTIRQLCAMIALSLVGGAAAHADIITAVSDANSDAAIPGGPTTQRENAAAGIIVPFGEDVFAYTDRTHQYNGPRFNAQGKLSTTPAAGDTVLGIPSYMLGGEYVSTRQNNRDNPAGFRINVTVNQPVKAYLLLDNRIGDPDNTTPPTIGGAIMQWVLDEGWSVVNTGISPGGQRDFIAADEGVTPPDFATRATDKTNLGVGPGESVNQFFSIYSKSFGAGDTIIVKEQAVGGINMYGLVVHAVPEPGTLSLLAAAAPFALRRGLRRR